MTAGTDGALEGRVTELEILVSFQQRTIEALDEVARELAGRVAGLEQRLAELRARVAAGDEPSGEDEAPPPHY